MVHVFLRHFFMSGKRNISTGTNAHASHVLLTSILVHFQEIAGDRHRKDKTVMQESKKTQIYQKTNKQTEKKKQQTRMKNIGKNKTGHTQEMVRTEFDDIQRTEEYQTGVDGDS